jgi:hypothetical protein
MYLEEHPAMPEDEHELVRALEEISEELQRIQWLLVGLLLIGLLLALTISW